MLNLISANIRFCSPDDGSNSWSARKEYLAKALIARSPDIVATQEGRRPQILEFSELLTDLSLMDSHRAWDDERMYPCLFINPSKFSVIDSGDFWLSETPNEAGSKSFGSPFPRMCTWTELDAGHGSFYVFNTHLDHTSEDIRLAQSEVLCNQIKQISQEKDLFLLGDFNTGPDSQVRNLIEAKLELVDPWTILNAPEETTYHHFQGSGFKGGKRIDWILSPKGHAIRRIEIIKDQPDEIYISDHYPVLVGLK